MCPRDYRQTRHIGKGHSVNGSTLTTGPESVVLLSLGVLRVTALHMGICLQPALDRAWLSTQGQQARWLLIVRDFCSRFFPI